MRDRASLILIVTLLVAATLCAQAQTQTQNQNQTQTQTEKPQTDAQLASKVFAYDRMLVKKSPNGTEGRSIPSFTLTTGEAVGMHESVQPAGATPVALHAIHHSELILIQEGSIIFEHDGKQEKAGPGDMIYVADGTTHRMTNVGTGPAKYVVVQIGGDTKK
jgi:mannose-6-phosphate isomerase-like protein (cupin superfamily)